ncbi:MAG: hypothetical protein HYW27_03775 [Candidatus Aenigmarchaeota archaeon]|nr:hypothetical protein [Candidatus Aenigmarchaeota archaeon]
MNIPIERMGKDTFRVGGREVRTLTMGADIFSERTLVYDMETEEYLGEFYGSPPPFPGIDRTFREDLARVVYGRE